MKKGFFWAHNMCESIILNVLAPFAMDQIIEKLKTVNFVTFMIDTSNHTKFRNCAHSYSIFRS